MKEDVINRIKWIGYKFEEADEWSLEFLIERVTEVILREINHQEIPGSLYWSAVDMVCGEFLREKAASAGGVESLESFNLDGAVKRIQVGDTSTEFAAGSGELTPSQRFESLVEALINNGRKSFGAYRRLRW